MMLFALFMGMSRPMCSQLFRGGGSDELVGFQYNQTILSIIFRFEQYVGRCVANTVTVDGRALLNRHAVATKSTLDTRHTTPLKIIMFFSLS